MSAQPDPDEVHDPDEGSWVYLSLGAADKSEVRRRVIAACEASGWPAVTWSPRPHQVNAADSARFFEGMGHAVEHADAVVVLMGDRSAMTDIELAFAYRHNRPVVGLRLGGQPPTSPAETMLDGHGRAVVIDCADINECDAALREALSSPGFAATVRLAASEQVDHG
jgi:hypothetical protein